MAPPLTSDLLAIPLRQLTDGQRLDGKSLVGFDRPSSSSVQPARCSARRQALTGPMPITDGSTPATAELTMRASTEAASKLARFIDAHQQDLPRRRRSATRHSRR